VGQEGRAQRALVDARVPDGEVRHRGEAANRLPVHPDGRAHRLSPRLAADAVLAGGDRDARGEPLDVPFERAGKGLVEVVDVEHELPLRRGEAAKVREVRVAAELDVNRRTGRACEVRRHHVRRAAVEGERGRDHPSVADRDELRKPRRGLLLEQRERIGSIAA